MEGRNGLIRPPFIPDGGVGQKFLDTDRPVNNNKR
jgi:hypothetical protein